MYETVEDLITAFCNEKLDADYRKLCLKALKRLQPETGNPHMWAAGIVYAIAQNAYFIGNKFDIFLGRPKYHLTSDEVATFFGVSKDGMTRKAKAIRETLKIHPDRDEWLTPELRESDGWKARKLLKKLM